MSKLHFDAVIFDLDGVITDTASIHSTSWKQMFDEFLKVHADRTETPFREFTHEKDYLPYVDGKPRYKGVASFLESRGINLPYGDPNDAPDLETVCGLGNRKNELFNEIIQGGKVNVYQSTVDFIHELRANGVRVGVASSSKNARTVLESVGLLELIETRVDGVVSAELGLKGKPEPDIFTTACDNLGIFYDRAVVVEDAISGVQAGSNGSFGLVIGIAREDNAIELKLNGADIVVEDMAEINIQIVEDWMTKRLSEEQWSISYYDYDPEKEGTRETLLTVGNGYFGTRGALEEIQASEFNYPGTYIAGLYNRLESIVAGRSVFNEDFVNCPNWLPITFKIGDGQWFDPSTTDILHITRRLDLRSGLLHRSMVIRDQAGNESRIESQRFASMDDPHLAALRYRIIPLNYEGTITVRSDLDGDLINYGVPRYRELNSKHLEPVCEGSKGNHSFLLVKTNQSNVLIGEAARLLVSANGREAKPDFHIETTPGVVSTSFEISAQKGVAITMDKIVAIFSSNQEAVKDPLLEAQNALRENTTFDVLRQASAEAWTNLWDKVDIRIEGDRTAQKLIRLHIYHSLVTASPHNAQLDAGIPARGLHGEAYRGHIFWDDLYILPLFDIHFPETAKSALMYRYRRLGQAQKYAHEHGYQGAMFPWQSGSDGSEESQVLHLNPMSGEWGADYSSLQRHVALSVAFNVWEYLWINDDQDFLENYAAELFFEICRFWASKASLNEETGRYSIDRVMGPDEYHEKYPGASEGGLKDNAYTNILVAWAFKRAFDLLDWMSNSARETLKKKINLSDEELARWKDISTKLNIPLSDEGILEQYAGYFDLEELDWDYYQSKYENIHRMDRILKAEGKSADAFKVSKQADVLMTFYVLCTDEIKEILVNSGYQSPDDLLRKNFYYYLNRTSHGSTLSRLVHAYLANIIGDKNLSWQLYTEALKSDFIDIQGGTTKEGIHAGVMAGTVIFALRAYAGIDWSGEQLKLNPRLPASWRGMQFSLTFKRNRYSFEISQEKVKVKLEGEVEKNILVGGTNFILQPSRWIEVELN
ncbi:MAG: HAD-IA family hydrolase [Anaerolineales bacterium]|nr:HAD-IA family hydrolase [Chloroflexota bacterium]MBL6980151.1 HAD-IA family hydrolase [Anaerolineales bacterium]